MCMAMGECVCVLPLKVHTIFIYACHSLPIGYSQLLLFAFGLFLFESATAQVLARSTDLTCTPLFLSLSLSFFLSLSPSVSFFLSLCIFLSLSFSLYLFFYFFLSFFLSLSLSLSLSFSLSLSSVSRLRNCKVKSK